MTHRRWFAAFLCLVLAAGCRGKDPLALGYDAFDQRPGSGWRQVAEDGRFSDAAWLIDAYLERHTELNDWQRANLSFHAGQMYAFANDYRTAIDRLNRSTDPEESRETPLRWNAYVHATIAFLEKDMTRLKECRQEIFDGPAFQGEKANLDVVDRLIKHFDEPYSKAYEAR